MAGQSELDSLRKDLDALFDIISTSDDDSRARSIILDIIQQGRQRIGSTEGVWIEIQEDQDTEILPASRTYKLGSSPLPNESRLHRHSTWDHRWETRHCKAEVFVRFTHPTIDQYINDAITCSAISGLASVIAAAASGNVAAGYGIFYPAWKLCMLTKLAASIVNDINVELFARTKCGCWENHC
jgi:hypothetical protein